MAVISGTRKKYPQRDLLSRGNDLKQYGGKGASSFSTGKWSNNLIFRILCTSLHTLVNKYVLSVLKFQYPTLFISWQCGISVFLIICAHVLGYAKLSRIDRSTWKMWLPSMVLHTAVMYFGSVSLSKLAVPIFIGLQNLTYLCIELLNFWRTKLFPAFTAQASLVMIEFGAIYLFYSNFQTNPVAYKWAIAYILCLGLYSLSLEIKKESKLSGLDRIFYNSLFCIIFLTVLSVATREWIKFFEFPFRHHGRFIAGCWSSGILSCLVSVIAHLVKVESSSEMSEAAVASGRILVFIVSFGIYEATLDARAAVSVIMLLLGGMVYTISKFTQNSLEKK